MTSNSPDQHLSRIETIWTVVQQAHGDGTTQIAHGQQRIIDRYSGAIYRYLLAVMRDSDAADEVFQEFAIRVLKGGFRHAAQERGRFRDYIKTAVLRLVSDFYRKRKKKDPALQAARLEDAGQFADETTDPASSFDKSFLESMRDELLGRAWGALKMLEENADQPFFSVLDYRARFPKSSSDDIADALTDQLQPEKPFTAASVRKTLQRSREKFSDLLLYEVSQMMGTHTVEELEAELLELGLQPYCQSALARRQAGQEPKAESGTPEN